jgi:hypothetical protein
MSSRPGRRTARRPGRSSPVHESQRLLVAAGGPTRRSSFRSTQAASTGASAAPPPPRMRARSAAQTGHPLLAAASTDPRAGPSSAEASRLSVCVTPLLLPATASERPIGANGRDRSSEQDSTEDGGEDTADAESGARFDAPARAPRSVKKRHGTTRQGLGADGSLGWPPRTVATTIGCSTCGRPTAQRLPSGRAPRRQSRQIRLFSQSCHNLTGSPAAGGPCPPACRS